MANNIVDTEENRILDDSLPTGAGAITIKLRSTAPTDSADGTAISGNGYADMTFAVGAASSGMKANTADILFAAATGSAWPEVRGYDIYVGANRRWYFALPAPDYRTINVGSQYKIAAGALTFALS